MDIKQIAEKIKECKDVLQPRIINGYYVRTIFCERVDEVFIKVLLVYKDKNNNEILQCNVDVENLFGGLLTTECYSLEDFYKDSEELAKQVIKYIKIAKKEK